MATGMSHGARVQVTFCVRLFAVRAGAAWAPDSSVLLLSSTGSNFLVGLHIVGQPTKLTEQLLPVALPGVSDREL